MIITYHLSADKLDSSVIRSIKAAFKGREIDIIVSDANDRGHTVDELLARIENIKNVVNTVTFSQEDFFTNYGKKIADATDQI
jgi:signal recognition particle GTPase